MSDDNYDYGVSMPMKVIGFKRRGDDESLVTLEFEEAGNEVTVSVTREYEKLFLDAFRDEKTVGAEVNFWFKR